MKSPHLLCVKSKNHPIMHSKKNCAPLETIWFVSVLWDHVWAMVAHKCTHSFWLMWSIWNNSFLNCGCRWKWRMIIAVNFPIWAIGKKKPEKKIRASTGFEPMTSALPVHCSTNWAMKPHIGSEANLLSSYLPWGVKWFEVYEIIHFWTAVVDESEEWSSQ